MKKEDLHKHALIIVSIIIIILRLAITYGFYLLALWAYNKTTPANFWVFISVIVTFQLQEIINKLKK
jgi:hypothetical protein